MYSLTSPPPYSYLNPPGRPYHLPGQPGDSGHSWHQHGLGPFGLHSRTPTWKETKVTGGKAETLTPLPASPVPPSLAASLFPLHLRPRFFALLVLYGRKLNFLLPYWVLGWDCVIKDRLTRETQRFINTYSSWYMENTQEKMRTPEVA